MKRFTPLFLLLFVIAPIGGCQLFSSNAEASSSPSVSESESPDVGEPDVPDESDGMMVDSQWPRRRRRIDPKKAAEFLCGPVSFELPFRAKQVATY
jgi:hypothetical protein